MNKHTQKIKLPVGWKNNLKVALYFIQSILVSEKKVNIFIFLF